MAIVVTRTEAALSATTSFQSMNNQFASSGLSLVVPSGVSQISSISMGVSSVGTGADFCSGFKLTGTALQEGDATFMGPAIAQAASGGTGVANCVVQEKLRSSGKDCTGCNFWKYFGHPSRSNDRRDNRF